MLLFGFLFLFRLLKWSRLGLFRFIFWLSCITHIFIPLVGMFIFFII